MRLADKSVGNGTVEGRVEVCINQAWGTVCSARFDQEDAGTVCVSAGGYLRSGMYVGGYSVMVSLMSIMLQLLLWFLLKHLEKKIVPYFWSSCFVPQPTQISYNAIVSLPRVFIVVLIHKMSVCSVQVRDESRLK